MFIKNQTPFLGKIKLKFEKHPHYSSGNNILNNVHLNLGFTKLVSRIQINEVFGDYQIHPEKLAKICLYTNGTIKKHYFLIYD